MRYRIQRLDVGHYRVQVRELFSWTTIQRKQPEGYAWWLSNRMYTIEEAFEAVEEHARRVKKV